MSEYKLTLEKREITGKKLKALRAEGKIPSVIYGGKTPILGASEYVATEKVLEKAGYHSPIDLDIAGKKQLAIVKSIQSDAVSRKIINVEFQAISANEEVTATTPIVIVNFEGSEAVLDDNLAKEFGIPTAQELLVELERQMNLKKKNEADNEYLEKLVKKILAERNVKFYAIDASKLASVEDKLVISDIVLPKGVEFADKELDMEQVVASLFDPAAEAAAREAEAEAEPMDAADVPADNGSKPEEASEEAKE